MTHPDFRPFPKSIKPRPEKRTKRVLAYKGCWIEIPFKANIKKAIAAFLLKTNRDENGQYIFKAKKVYSYEPYKYKRQENILF